jgi:hypothetical protein
MNWLAAVPAHVVPRPQAAFQPAFLFWLTPVISESAESRSANPAVPPPEVA